MSSHKAIIREPEPGVEVPAEHPNCRHKNIKFGYCAFFDDAKRRYKNGERQSQCPHCQKWIWNSLYAEVDGE